MRLSSPQLDYIIDVMKRFEYPWFIAGGWVIDLALGKQTRTHDDIDICIYREHTQYALDYFKEWKISVAIPGESRLMPVESLRDTDFPRYGLHLHKGNEFIEILLTDQINGEVIFRKNEEIALPVDSFERIDAYGRPYIAPEWQLLYKSKEGRQKDQQDFESCLPVLDENARKWLRCALKKFKPESSWLQWLTPFKDVITSEEELRSLLGYPSDLVRNKTIDFLDEHCMHFISQSPFVVLSTSNADGACDASPRGDSPGFVKVIDNKHLLIPERPGNRKLDSILNILVNPNVGILFIIPGLNETLRINGHAYVVTDERLLEAMTVEGKRPLCAIGVEVNECFVQCAKAFMRSQLWQPHSWPSKDVLPSPSQMLAEHAKLPNMSEKEVAAALAESYTKRLY